MSTAYLAICYACNEKCLYCPCSQVEKQQKMFTDISELEKSVDGFYFKGISDITISGGEPTLHPQIIELIAYIHAKGMTVSLLSNSELFSNIDFVTSFSNSIEKQMIKIITTLHSQDEVKHEIENQTKGSFKRTLSGLQNLQNCGMRTIVKHCITKSNYTELELFYNFCDNAFAIPVDIQLCSIDYCGIPNDKLENKMLAFTMLRPHLESLFDLHILKVENGSQRNLYCINIPLCSCDVFYWRFLKTNKNNIYSLYKDPHNANSILSTQNIGIDINICKNCKVKNICAGTYRSAFEIFGQKIVKAFM